MKIGEFCDELGDYQHLRKDSVPWIWLYLVVISGPAVCGDRSTSFKLCSLRVNEKFGQQALKKGVTSETQ
jgi:hypothetical protein